MANLQPLPSAQEPVVDRAGKVTPRWRDWLQRYASFVVDLFASTIDLTSGQIKFPAIQKPSTDPNTLDDYEEGAWTPTLAFGGASVGIVYSVQEASYTKIGRLVTLNCRLQITNKGSSTGSPSIGGLPFAPPGIRNGISVSYYAGVNTVPMLLGYANGSAIELLASGSSGAVALTQANIGNNFDVAFSLAYSV